MKLDSARLRGFRSVRDVRMDHCGGFNVIIGKNNAGKSNLLMGLHAFFGCIAGGAPVSISPPIGKPIDFHSRDEKGTIDLTLSFAIDQAERGALIADIEHAAPQVRNALERLASDLILSVTVTVPRRDPPFAYVREMTLARSQLGEGVFEYALLRVDSAAADELAHRARQAESHLSDAEGTRKVIDSLRQFGNEFWERVRIDTKSSRGALFRYTSAGSESPLSTATRARIEDLAAASESFNAFREHGSALIAELEKQAAAVRATPLVNRVDTFAGQEPEIPPYALNLLRKVAAINILYLTERREPIGRREANQLLDLKVTRGGTEKLRNIQQTVSALLGVEIDAFRSESGGRRPETLAELDVDNFLVQVNGAGIRESLRLILDYEFKRPSLLLVEEPEIHLHPALETSMMRYLKSVGKEAQIFITTHSTNFLDTAEMRNVYLATKNGATSVQRIDVAEAEAAVPRELGIRLSSLFMYDRLVFVEGASDEEVLREWAATLGVNFGAASVGFVPMGGVRNLAHFAADQTLSFLTKRRVGLWFLMDRDEREDEEVARLEKALGHQARLVVLKRREIENYLLDPATVTSVIREKLATSRKADELPTEHEVELTILEAADELRGVAVDYRVAQRICVPIYPDRRAVLDVHEQKPLQEKLKSELARLERRIAEAAARVEDTIAEVGEEVEAQWAGQKLDIVPGDILLGRVFQRFGLRFRKERDSVRLAGAMQRERIPDEIRHLVTSIGA